MLSKFKYDVKYQNKFAGTETIGEDQKAKVYYYRTDDEAKNILLSFSNKLYEWVQPKLPEDLSFIYNNSYVFINTSHEKTSGIYINETININKIKSITGIKGKLTQATQIQIE